MEQRETWGRRYDFLFSLIGFSVGFGNVWRFPYLCYKNGGGAFLIPYFISVALMGLTMLLLEVALGQFTSSGCIKAWNIVPLFQGVGYASMVIANWIVIYYIVIVAWSLHYMLSSFTSELPWSHCNNPWNTDTCVTTKQWHYHTSNTAQMNTTLNSTETSSNAEFWERKILRMSDGLGDPGSPGWELTLCLMFSWLFCYLSVFRGIKATAKVLYFTVTIPFVLLLILMVRAVTLDGAMQGLRFFVNIDLSKLADGQVWQDAATQVLFSFSVGMGTMTSLGSYNKFHKNMYRSCLIFTGVDVFTSLLAGVVIFSVLGFLAKQEGCLISDIADSGPGLVFVVYPAALSKMPVAPLWSVFFFLMMVLIGIDSQYVAVAGFIRAITDVFPQHVGPGRRREIFTGILCVIWFLIGLSMVTKGGIYVFHLFDVFAASGPTLLLMVFFESIVIGWFYGGDSFLRYMSGMNGYSIDSTVKAIWMYLAPPYSMGVFIFSVVNYKPLRYDKYDYPAWAQAIGWLMTLSSFVCIPVVAIIKLIKTEGTFRGRWTKLTTVEIPENIRSGQNDMKMQARSFSVASALPRPSTSDLGICNPATETAT